MNELSLEAMINLGMTVDDSVTLVPNDKFITVQRTHAFDAVLSNNVKIGYFEVYQGYRLSWSHNVGEVGIYVKPQFRGQGYAKKIYEAALKTLSNQDFLYAIVNEKNETSMKLHQSLGFKQIRRIPDIGGITPEFAVFRVQ